MAKGARGQCGTEQCGTEQSRGVVWHGAVWHCAVWHRVVWHRAVWHGAVGRRGGDPSGLSDHIRESYGWKKSVNRSNEQQEGEEGLSGEAQISGEEGGRFLRLITPWCPTERGVWTGKNKTVGQVEFRNIGTDLIRLLVVVKLLQNMSV